MLHVQSTSVQTSLLYQDHITSHPTPDPLTDDPRKGKGALSQESDQTGPHAQGPGREWGEVTQGVWVGWDVSPPPCRGCVGARLAVLLCVDGVAAAAQGIMVRTLGPQGSWPHGTDTAWPLPQDPTFEPCQMKTHFLLPFPVNYVAECIRTAPYAAPDHARCVGLGPQEQDCVWLC